MLRFTRGLKKFWDEHWIWYSIIANLPTIWFSFILTYLGSGLGLICVSSDNEMKLTSEGMIGTALMGIIALSMVIMNNYLNHIEYVYKKQEITYLKQLNERFDDVCDEKLKSLLDVVKSVHRKKQSAMHIVPSPQRQLEEIISSINKTLVCFLERSHEKITQQDLLISIIYRIPAITDEWNWVERTESTKEKRISLKALMEGKSTFRHIIDSGIQYYFSNEKEEAQRKGEYLYDSLEMTRKGEPVGSIYCNRFVIAVDGLDVGGSGVAIDAILSISTQGKRFVAVESNKKSDEEKIMNVRDNIHRIVSESFGKRIRIELCSYYLEKMYKNKNKTKIKTKTGNSM